MMEPMFTIKQLMYEKYGEDRYAIACEITARWVQFETKNKSYDADWVNQMANAPPVKVFELLPDAAKALSRLFGLKSIEELFTINELYNGSDK